MNRRNVAIIAHRSTTARPHWCERLIAAIGVYRDNQRQVERAMDFQ